MWLKINSLIGDISENYLTWFFRNWRQIKAENQVKSVPERREIWDKIKLAKKCIPIDVLEQLI